MISDHISSPKALVFWPPYLPVVSSEQLSLAPSMRITKAQLKGLDQYKYSGIDKSVVSRYALGPFWTWLVTIMPRNLAPNSVSLALRMVILIQ